MYHDLLTHLEKNAHLSPNELALYTGQNEQEIADEIKRLENEGIICGYSALINWDKTEREYITALIEVKVTPARGQGFDRIAERIYNYDEVSAVYLMSGGFDLTVIVEGRTMKDIAFFVNDKLATLDSVLSTATHFVLKKYKDHGMILDAEKSADERMIISP
jgi:DNA-binding Lrp family transcriptional regulator